MRSKKGEASKFFDVHEGGKMCQAGAKGTFFYAKGRTLYLFCFFQVVVPKMTSSHNFLIILG